MFPFCSKIKKGTEEFFCLCDDEQQRQLLQQKWMARRKRYYSKRYGQLVNPDQLDGDATPRFASVSSSRSGHMNVFMTVSPAQGHPPVLQMAKSRKESVASMAWQGLKTKIIVSTEGHSRTWILLHPGRSLSVPAITTSRVWDQYKIYSALKKF